MGLFSSTDYREKYIETLEKRLASLENELKSLKDANERLVSRLLLKNNVPMVHEKMSPSDVDGLVAKANIFDDIDEEDEIIDNRKESLDAFAS